MWCQNVENSFGKKQCTQSETSGHEAHKQRLQVFLVHPLVEHIRVAPKEAMAEMYYVENSSRAAADMEL